MTGEEVHKEAGAEVSGEGLGPVEDEGNVLVMNLGLLVTKKASSIASQRMNVKVSAKNHLCSTSKWKIFLITTSK